MAICYGSFNEIMNEISRESTFCFKTVDNTHRNIILAVYLFKELIEDQKRRIPNCYTPICQSLENLFRPISTSSAQESVYKSVERSGSVNKHQSEINFHMEVGQTGFKSISKLHHSNSDCSHKKTWSVPDNVRILSVPKLYLLVQVPKLTLCYYR